MSKERKIMLEVPINSFANGVVLYFLELDRTGQVSSNTTDPSISPGIARINYTTKPKHFWKHITNLLISTILYI